jgi:hypothetical protein
LPDLLFTFFEKVFSQPFPAAYIGQEMHPGRCLLITFFTPGTLLTKESDILPMLKQNY